VYEIVQYTGWPKIELPPDNQGDRIKTCQWSWILEWILCI